jgi:hypothetical protein
MRWNIDNTGVQNGITQLDIGDAFNTLDANPLVIWDSSVVSAPITNNITAHVFAFVEMIRTDGLSGGAWVLSATFRNHLGMTQIGTTTVVSVHKDNPAYDATIALNGGGTAIQVIVTGVNGEDLTWSRRVTIQVVVNTF